MLAASVGHHVMSYKVLLRRSVLQLVWWRWRHAVTYNAVLRACLRRRMPNPRGRCQMGRSLTKQTVAGYHMTKYKALLEAVFIRLVWQRRHMMISNAVLRATWEMRQTMNQRRDVSAWGL